MYSSSRSRPENFDSYAKVLGRKENGELQAVYLGVEKDAHGRLAASDRRLVTRAMNGHVSLSICLGNISDWNPSYANDGRTELEVRTCRGSKNRVNIHRFYTEGPAPTKYLREVTDQVLRLLSEIEDQRHNERRQEALNSSGKRHMRVPDWDRADIKRSPPTFSPGMATPAPAAPRTASLGTRNTHAVSARQKPSDSTKFKERPYWASTPISSRNFSGKELECLPTPSKDGNRITGKDPARSNAVRGASETQTREEEPRTTRQRATEREIRPEAVARGSVRPEQVAEQEAMLSEVSKRRQGSQPAFEPKDSSSKGLLNLNSISSLGASLQALLANFAFIYELDRLSTFVEGTPHLPLDSVYSRLLDFARDVRDKRWSSRSKKKKSSSDPEAVIKAVMKRVDSKLGEGEDAHEFVLKMLSILKSEFGVAVKSSGGDPSIIPSAVDRSFNVVVETALECEACKHASDPKLETHVILSLSTEEVRGANLTDGIGKDTQNDRNQDLDEFRRRTTGRSVADLLSSYFEKETVDYKCEACADGKTAVASKKIKMLPRILILHLKRHQHSPTGALQVSTPVSVPFIVDVNSLTTSSPITPSLYDDNALEAKLKAMKRRKRASATVVDLDRQMTSGEKLSALRRRAACALMDDAKLLRVLDCTDGDLDEAVKYVEETEGKIKDEYQALDMINVLIPPEENGAVKSRYFLESYVHRSAGGKCAADILECGSWTRYSDSSVKDLAKSPHYQEMVEREGYLFFYAHEQYHRLT